MTWVDGFAEYSRSLEVAEHRARHTYGGDLWPEPPRPAEPSGMTTGELLDEAEWLLDGGTAAWIVATQLATTLHRLQRLARNHHRDSLVGKLSRAIERDWYGRKSA